MINYMSVIEKATGVCLKRNLLGAGGGIAAGLHAFLGAQLMHGIDGILNLTNFKEVAASADIVITGEGKTDRQTLHGKAPTGVLKLCQKLGVPVVLLSGCIDLHEYNYDFNGFAAFISTVFIENSKYQKNYDMQLKVAARNVFSLIKLGSIFRGNSCLGKGRMRTPSKANGRSKEPELFI